MTELKTLLCSDESKLKLLREAMNIYDIVEGIERTLIKDPSKQIPIHLTSLVNKQSSKSCDNRGLATIDNGRISCNEVQTLFGRSIVIEAIKDTKVREVTTTITIIPTTASKGRELSEQENNALKIKIKCCKDEDGQYAIDFEIQDAEPMQSLHSEKDRKGQERKVLITNWQKSAFKV